MTYRVLVTGGRDYTDRGRVMKDLSRIFDKHRDMVVISGMARGADQHALDFALLYGLDYEGYAAKWNEDGKAAGLLRNQRMIDTKPDLVVAFPGGKGTADCVERAKKAGLTLWDRRTVDGHSS